jgi:hypothetical protein
MHRIKTSSVRRGVTRPERIAAEGGGTINLFEPEVETLDRREP